MLLYEKEKRTFAAEIFDSWAFRPFCLSGPAFMTKTGCPDMMKICLAGDGVGRGRKVLRRMEKSRERELELHLSTWPALATRRKGKAACSMVLMQKW
jgi:hypothetical protein